MGVIAQFPRARHLRAAPHFWRTGDVARAGANHVRIAALNGDVALVVGEAPSGPWSIWMEVSKLEPAEVRGQAPPAMHRTERPMSNLRGAGHRLALTSGWPRCSRSPDGKTQTNVPESEADRPPT